MRPQVSLEVLSGLCNPGDCLNFTQIFGINLVLVVVADILVFAAGVASARTLEIAGKTVMVLDGGIEELLVVVERLELLQQCPIEAVITSHHQLRIDAAVLVGGIGVGTDRPCGLLPLLKASLGQLALQLVGGLLPGLSSAVAHLHGVIARALDLGFLGVDGRGHKENGRGDQQVPHLYL